MKGVVSLILVLFHVVPRYLDLDPGFKRLEALNWWHSKGKAPSSRWLRPCSPSSVNGRRIQGLESVAISSNHGSQSDLWVDFFDAMDSQLL